MKLAAVLACRNQSSRLYGKPLQHLDVENKITILDYIIAQLRKRSEINDIVLAISDREENNIYQSIAKSQGIPYVTGDDHNVLERLIMGAELVGADNVFRVTTESPYACLDNFAEVYEHHQRHAMDFSNISNVPDGAEFQIIRTDALRRCRDEGEDRHRSEYCTLYIFENQDKFKIMQHAPPSKMRRKADMRLTVDWPEDLVVMREIYQGLGLDPSEQLSFGKIIDFLDEHPKINALNNWIDSGAGRAWA